MASPRITLAPADALKRAAEPERVCRAWHVTVPVKVRQPEALAKAIAEYPFPEAVNPVKRIK